MRSPLYSSMSDMTGSSIEQNLAPFSYRRDRCTDGYASQSLQATVEILGPERYRLRFDSKCFSSTCARGTNKFSGFTAQKAPKLYIITASNELIYVGATLRLRRELLRNGWSAAGKTGY